MGNLNKVLLIGRLGQEPEKRVTPQGHSVVSVSLATSEKFKDKSGNRQEKTEWHRVVFWNQMAELVAQYCKKGSQLYVEGQLQTNEWQDKDGNKRYTTEIQARQMQFLDTPQGQGGQGGAQQGGGYQQQGGGYQGASQGGGQQGGGQYGGGAPSQAPPSGPVGGNDFIEDDIPF